MRWTASGPRRLRADEVLVETSPGGDHFSCAAADGRGSYVELVKSRVNIFLIKSLRMVCFPAIKQDYQVFIIERRKSYMRGERNVETEAQYEAVGQHQQ